MHSAEPTDANFEDSSNHHTDEAWRAEVVSRLSNYRARRKHNSENAASLDFGPETEAHTVGSGAVAQSAGSKSPAQPTRSAFDTNYYRRLNAESLNPETMLPGASITMGATAAAISHTSEIDAETEAPNAADAQVAADDDPALDLEIRPNAAENSFLDRYCISEPEPEAELAQPVPPPTPVAEPVVAAPANAQGNLIVFRRPLLEPPLIPQPSRDELAEPMNRRPRILEVPEDIMPAVQGSLFPEIRLDGDDQETSSNHEPEIQVPLRVALISERLLASLADMGVVAAGGLLFAAIALRALPDISHTKPFYLMMGAVTVLFWAVYQHLFLLYGGRTPGMTMRGIHLSTFDGHAPGWSQRNNRARFMCISFVSVSLGFLWALVDKDTLCWHDRISETFPTME